MVPHPRGDKALTLGATVAAEEWVFSDIKALLEMQDIVDDENADNGEWQAIALRQFRARRMFPIEGRSRARLLAVFSSKDWLQDARDEYPHARVGVGPNVGRDYCVAKVEILEGEHQGMQGYIWPDVLTVLVTPEQAERIKAKMESDKKAAAIAAEAKAKKREAAKAKARKRSAARR